MLVCDVIVDGIAWYELLVSESVTYLRRVAELESWRWSRSGQGCVVLGASSIIREGGMVDIDKLRILNISIH